MCQKQREEAELDEFVKYCRDHEFNHGGLADDDMSDDVVEHLAGKFEWEDDKKKHFAMALRTVFVEKMKAWPKTTTLPRNYRSVSNGTPSRPRLSSTNCAPR